MDIPRDAMVVFTGAPDVDEIDGLPPAVALQQRRGGGTSRSTVGTVTTLSNSQRMLFSRAELDVDPLASRAENEVWSLQAMYQREHDRTSAPGQTGRPRRGAHPVLALQRLIGNRGTTQLLARQKKKNKGTFEHSVKFGKLAPIEIKGGNVGDWVAKKDPETLVLTTTKGKHSDELKRRSESRERIETLTVQSVVGENTFVVITFSNARIKGYAEGSEKTEDWQVVDFDAVHRETTSIGKARP